MRTGGHEAVDDRVLHPCREARPWGVDGQIEAGSGDSARLESGAANAPGLARTECATSSLLAKPSELCAADRS